MLDIRQFDRISPDTILYSGEYLYFIVSDDTGITVTARDIDANGDEVIVHCCAASTLSTAIATIEALENGEEV